MCLGCVELQMLVKEMYLKIVSACLVWPLLLETTGNSRVLLGCNFSSWEIESSWKTFDSEVFEIQLTFSSSSTNPIGICFFLFCKGGIFRRSRGYAPVLFSWGKSPVPTFLDHVCVSTKLLDS